VKGAGVQAPPPGGAIAWFEMCEARMSQATVMASVLETVAPQLAEVRGMGEEELAPPYARYEWMQVAIGIMAAGGAYGIVLAAIGTVVALFQALLHALNEGFDPFAIAGVILFTLLYAAMCAFFGVIYSGFVSLFVMPAFCLLVRTIVPRIGFVWLGAICGGLVGFVAVMPFLVLAHCEWSDSFGASVMVAALGPALTTVLGQIGGAWGARRSVRCATQDLRVVGDDEAELPRVQFTIRQMIWLTTWISGLFAVLRLFSLPGEYILPVIFAWLVYQSGTLLAGWYLAYRIQPWLRRR
jgi:hypothetical protein